MTVIVNSSLEVSDMRPKHVRVICEIFYVMYSWYLIVNIVSRSSLKMKEQIEFEEGIYGRLRDCAWDIVAAVDRGGETRFPIGYLQEQHIRFADVICRDSSFLGHRRSPDTRTS